MAEVSPWERLRTYEQQLTEANADALASPEVAAHTWSLNMTEGFHISDRTVLRDSVIALLKARDASKA